MLEEGRFVLKRERLMLEERRVHVRGGEVHDGGRGSY